MRVIGRSVFVGICIACLLAGAGVAAAVDDPVALPAGLNDGSPEVAAIQYGSDAVTWQPKMAFERGVLIVSGRDGVVSRQDFQYADAISFNLIDQKGQPLPDGAYTFELRLFKSPSQNVEAAAKAADVASTEAAPTQDSEAQARIRGNLAFQKSGRFRVANGRVVPPATPRLSSRTPEAVSKAYSFTGDYKIDGKLQVGSDQTAIEDVIIQCESDDGECPAGILFQNATTGAVDASQSWDIQVSTTEMRMRNGGTLDGDDVLTMEAGAPNDSLYIDSTGNIGIGTATPETLLHAEGGNGEFRVSRLGAYAGLEVGNLAAAWRMMDDAVGSAEYTPVFIQHVTSPTFPLIYITSDENIGIGTATPERKLHLSGTDQTTTRIQVNNTSGTTAQRILFKLENNGPTNFAINNTATSSQWTFAVTNSGFAISKDGSGVQEMVVTGGGNMTIAGTLNELSDVNAKEGFEVLDSSDVLAKVAALPMTEWNFKNDGSRIRHIGPMAQDFRAAFGLGADERHIAPLDAAGVALAAVQGLQRENEELRQRIEQLEALVASLAD